MNGPCSLFELTDKPFLNPGIFAEEFLPIQMADVANRLYAFIEPIPIAFTLK
jgi:hypothetical protein